MSRSSIFASPLSTEAISCYLEKFSGNHPFFLEDMQRNLGKPNVDLARKINLLQQALVNINSFLTSDVFRCCGNQKLLLKMIQEILQKHLRVFQHIHEVASKTPTETTGLLTGRPVYRSSF